MPCLVGDKGNYFEVIWTTGVGLQLSQSEKHIVTWFNIRKLYKPDKNSDYNASNKPT